MPRQQNIFAENPVLQGAKVLTEGFGSFADQVTKTRKDYVTFNLLQNVGKARNQPNFQSILDKVSYGLKQDEVPTEGAVNKALTEAGKPGEVQNVDMVALYDRTTRDRKRAALADAAIQAETGMQKEAQLATISANLGAVGWMNPQQQNALMMGLSGSMDGFNLSSIFDKMGLGGAGSSGGGSGSGGSGKLYKSKEWVDNGDGTQTLMLLDDMGNVFPATGTDGGPVVKIKAAGKPGYDLEGDTGIITMPPEMANMDAGQRAAWKENVIASARLSGYENTGWDGVGTLFFRKVGKTGGGGGKSPRDAAIDKRTKALGDLKKTIMAEEAKAAAGDKDARKRADFWKKQYNDQARAMREVYDLEHARHYPNIPIYGHKKGKKGVSATASSSAGKKR